MSIGQDNPQPPYGAPAPPPGPGAPYGAPYGAPPPPPPAQGTNGLAIAGFVLAFLIAPIGFILSIVGLILAGKNRQKGKGLAIAGIIISVIIGGLGTVALVAATKTVAKLADPGCVQGKSLILEKADKISDPTTGKAALKELVDGLSAASAKATHADSRKALKDLSNDYASLLQSLDAGTVPDSALISKVGTDAAAIDSACTLGGGK
jgi:hypothetical protein